MPLDSIPSRYSSELTLVFNDRDSTVPFAVGLLLALFVHAGIATTTNLAPPRKMQEAITMAIYHPPPKAEPPPPPPPPPPEKKPPPPPPKKDPPPPPPPPPPNQEPPPEPPKEPVPVVAGISMSSTVSGTSGFQVRVGNSTQADPNKQKFVDPKDVKPYAGGSPEFHAARASTITKEPKVLYQHKYYPKDLAEQELQGSVVLLVDLTKTGVIRDVRIAKSSGNVQLDKVAQDNLRHFRFEAAQVNGEAVDYILRYTYTFDLLD